MSSYLHKTTHNRIKALSSTDFQPILLRGAYGVDIEGAIQAITATYTADTFQSDDQSFSTVEDVRNLYELTKTVPAGTLVVSIRHAEKLSPAAQNALLKLLEEPPMGYLFILSTNSSDTLLPTVLSRVKIIEVLPITEAESSDLLDELGVMNATSRQQILFIANGLPDHIKKLASDSVYFEKEVSLIKDARSLLQSRTYDALKIVDRYKSDRDDALDVVLYSAKLLVQALKNSPSVQISDKLEQVTRTYNDLSSNANIRTALMRLVV
jgi:replication-associated recombination protein RarA